MIILQIEVLCTVERALYGPNAGEELMSAARRGWARPLAASFFALLHRRSNGLGSVICVNTSMVCGQPTPS
jgi:hypothetical protein